MPGCRRVPVLGAAPPPSLMPGPAAGAASRGGRVRHGRGRARARGSLGGHRSAASAHGPAELAGSGQSERGSAAALTNRRAR